MLRPLQTIALILALAACAAKGPEDLTLVSVERTTYDRMPEPPGQVVWGESDKALQRWNDSVGQGDRPRVLRALRVQFSSAVNIVQMIVDNHWSAQVETTFCDRLLIYAELSPADLYIDDWRVSAVVDPDYLKHGIMPTGGLYLYDVYVYAQGREANYGPGATQSFNLSSQPHDICFTIVGGGYFDRFESNAVRIPKSAIAEALRHGRVVVGR